jgi:hypothetical protein
MLSDQIPDERISIIAPSSEWFDMGVVDWKGGGGGRVGVG